MQSGIHGPYATQAGVWRRRQLSSSVVAFITAASSRHCSKCQNITRTMSRSTFRLLLYVHVCDNTVSVRSVF